MKRVILLLICELFVLGQARAEEIVWVDISRGNTHIRSVLVEPDKPGVIYFGSDKGVFKSEDAGLTWRNILSVRGGNTFVNFISRSVNGCLYAATGNGLYASMDRGRWWRRIYKGKNISENDCTVILVDRMSIFLGTKGGLFISNDSGRTFHRENSKLGASCIFAITLDKKDPDSIYAACVDGIFRSLNHGVTWERVFVAQPVENGFDAEEETEDIDEEKRHSGIRYVTANPEDSNSLFMASVSGLQVSRDKGMSWEVFTDFGLLNKDVKQLSFSKKDEFYALTKSGVFKYVGSRWQELSFGLAASKVNFISLGHDNNLYAACDEGLFVARLRIDVSWNNSAVPVQANEPDIKSVQKAAIKYAEVSPDKIIRWRKQAAKKALLPQFSAGISRNATDLWHWEGGSTTRPEDDTLRKGQDSLNWDVKLSWNLGDLIWTDDQTAIDVRSRLMVQLRDDILDEVNKLYFERLRVRNEIEGLGIEERKKRTEKELRLAELTASIDALTGGYFSQNIKETSSPVS